MATGLHICSYKRAGKPALWYVYAWRGGPRIHVSEGQRLKITVAILDAAADARRELRQAPKDTLSGLIAGVKASAEWNKLAKSTKANWQTWFTRIETEFSDAPLKTFNDRRMRGEILEWRDRWAQQPRTADMAMQAFSRVLSFGFDRGQLTQNILVGIERHYDNDRSNQIWDVSHFEQIMAHASVEVMEGIELAASTGLRRGDLVKLPWDAVGEHAIIWKTGKSRGKAQIVVPLLPETKALLARIKARCEAAARSLPATVLSNSKWQPWTAMGFGSRFNDAKVAAGIKLHLHDLRSTFATRCMIAGLTDQEIADILGWTTKDVAAIRVKYVDQVRVVVALAERISKAKPLRGQG